MGAADDDAGRESCSGHAEHERVVQRHPDDDRQHDEHGVEPIDSDVSRRSADLLQLVLSNVAPILAPRELHVAVADWEFNPCAFGWRTEETSWLLFPELATFAFRPGSNVVTAFVGVDLDRDTLYDVYLTTVLPIAAQVVLGYQSLHGSAVLVEGGVVAFCGNSGSGKTTLAYALSQRGHVLWGDDVVVLDAAASDEISAVRVPFQLNLRPPSRTYFGNGEALTSELVSDDASDAKNSLLSAIVVLEPEAPELVGAAPAIELLEAADAFPAVLSHAYNFQPQAKGEKANVVRDYLAIVAQVPVYRVRYRHEFACFPGLLERLEQTFEAS